LQAEHGEPLSQRVLRLLHCSQASRGVGFMISAEDVEVHLRQPDLRCQFMTSLNKATFEVSHRRMGIERSLEVFGLFLNVNSRSRN
jgi:hypothetical protein